MNNKIPEIWVEIRESRKRKTLIGVIYRKHRWWGEGAQTKKNNPPQSRTVIHDRPDLYK